MHSATLNSPLLTLPPSCFSISPNPSTHNPLLIRFKPRTQFKFKSLQCAHRPSDSNTRNPNSLTAPTRTISAAVDDKIRSLVSEFKSMSDPVDRVRRLLHYAALLPQFEESGRVESNRVRGCTAQVWLEATVEAGGGAVRFRADSDSEITKGFCYCLIWLLDGAAPEEVLMVKTEDLGELNVGLHLQSRTASRVNAWYNVLISMQRRTEALVAERESQPPLPSEPFSSSLVVTADAVATAMGSDPKSEIPWSALTINERLLDEFADSALV